MAQSLHRIYNNNTCIIMTCSEKRDHSGYFIKIEFLAWNDSSVCAESNGASLMKKLFNIDHK